MHPLLRNRLAGMSTSQQSEQSHQL